MEQDKETENTREYVKALIENLRDQKKYCMLIVTFNVVLLGIITNRALFANISPPLDLPQKILLVAAITALGLAAAVEFIWVALLLTLSVKAVDCLFHLETDDLRTEHYPGNCYARAWGWIHALACLLMAVGIVLTLLLVVLRLW